jgi:hypothetical protein
MSIFFKVFHCRTPKELFTGIRSFRVHEVSPPDGLLLYWQEEGRCYFPFRPRAKIWYHRPRRGQSDTSRFALFGKCWSGQPNAKLVVEVR